MDRAGRAPARWVLGGALPIVKCIESRADRPCSACESGNFHQFDWRNVGLRDQHMTATPAMCKGNTIPPRCILIRREHFPADPSYYNSSRTKTLYIPKPLFRRMLRIRRLQKYTRPEAFVVGIRGSIPSSEMVANRERLLEVGRELSIPWLSWQAPKRGHQALLGELRDQLSGNLVASAR